MRPAIRPDQAALLNRNGDRAEVAKQVAMVNGDEFELSARVCLGAYGNRQHHPDEEMASFEQGYRVACREIALVLRSMRRGEPPTKDELESERLKGMLIGP